MAFRASMRRDQRRRLLASRQRDAADADGLTADGSDRVAVTAYDDEALPERHPALATRLPVGAGRLVAVASAILLVFSGAITLAVSGPLFGRPLVGGGGRFARTLAVIAAAFDARAGMPVQVWLAELALLAAAAIAGAIRLMRRHRRDDYKGRFRAWGWLAWMLAAAAWAGAVPVGSFVAALLSDATGITPGPNGIGWWLGLAAVGFAVVVPWAVLPLRERGATLTWMLLAMAAWSVAAAMPWAPSWAAAWFGGEARGAVVAQAAWVAGAGLVLVALLAAARGVIREVRGLCAAEPPRRAKRKRAAAEATGDRSERRADDEAAETTADDSWDDSRSEGDDDAQTADDGGDTDFVDGSEGGGRRLSKAERKRLRKLARMNGHAA
ncbi:MAG: hypothetical protein ACKO1M_12200 [Planctomycetota bacterium]